MRGLTWAMALAAGLSGAPGGADVPEVVTDILPVQSLAARVMQGMGDPSVIVRPGASPHGYALRPSEAQALEQADLVFFVSGNLTGWFEDALETLGHSERAVELLETPGSTRLDFRESALFETHTDGAEDDAQDGHDHADDDAHDHGHGDHHGEFDPHAWLDPENGKIWLGHIAEALAEADPENAAAYRANAYQGQAEIDAAVARARARLEPVRHIPFFAYHDAYQYFDRAFGLNAVGAIAAGDAAQPGPRRIAQLRDTAAEKAVACVFTEPQFNSGLLTAIADGDDFRTAALDPLGADLPPGAQLIPALIEGLAQDVAACLSAE